MHIVLQAGHKQPITSAHHDPHHRFQTEKNRGATTSEEQSRARKKFNMISKEKYIYF
jgi:hypothetical protein